jgi:hypothetical protein
VEEGGAAAFAEIGVGQLQTSLDGVPLHPCSPPAPHGSIALIVNLTRTLRAAYRRNA